MKTIKTTNGVDVIVDDEWYYPMSLVNWHAKRPPKSLTSYAFRHGAELNGVRSTITMHRVITSCPLGMEVDHINGNGLDNRLENLRVCSRLENHRSRGPQKNNTSGTIGVHWSKSIKRWIATIGFGGKHIHIGCYVEKEDAVRARLEAQRFYFGEFAPRTVTELCEKGSTL